MSGSSFQDSSPQNQVKGDVEPSALLHKYCVASYCFPCSMQVWIVKKRFSPWIWYPWTGRGKMIRIMVLVYFIITEFDFSILNVIFCLIFWYFLCIKSFKAQLFHICLIKSYDFCLLFHFCVINVILINHFTLWHFFLDLWDFQTI